MTKELKIGDKLYSQEVDSIQKGEMKQTIDGIEYRCYPVNPVNEYDVRGFVIEREIVGISKKEMVSEGKVPANTGNPETFYYLENAKVVYASDKDTNPTYLPDDFLVSSYHVNHGVVSYSFEDAKKQLEAALKEEKDYLDKDLDDSSSY